MTPTRNRRSLPIFPLALALMVVLGVVAVVVTCLADDGAGEGTETAAVSVTGDPLSPLAQPGADDAVGRPAPVLAGTGVDGQPLTIDPGTGGPVAIVFLAHWCPHCQREVVEVQRWLDTDAMPDGVRLRAVSTLVTADRPNYPPSDWLADAGWSVPTLADDEHSTAANAYGLDGTPYWVFVDGDGSVVGRSSGSLPIAALDATLQDLAGHDG